MQKIRRWRHADLLRRRRHSAQPTDARYIIVWQCRSTGKQGSRSGHPPLPGFYGICARPTAARSYMLRIRTGWILCLILWLRIWIYMASSFCSAGSAIFWRIALLMIIWRIIYCQWHLEKDCKRDWVGWVCSGGKSNFKPRLSALQREIPARIWSQIFSNVRKIKKTRYGIWRKGRQHGKKCYGRIIRRKKAA